MKRELKVCWLSAGISSFIAGYLERETVDKYIYIDIEDQHPDSLRFIRDCEKLLGTTVEILCNSEYKNVENCIKAAGVIRNPYNQFAPCTNWLKKRVRKEWEEQHNDYDITYIWGFDVEEKHRAERLLENMPQFNHIFPLINKSLTKQDCHAIADRLGIKRPKMYDLGYQNNNCVGCIKGGMWYWNQIRKDFPEIFEARSKLEREIGASIIKGIYLDELAPDRGRKEEEISTDCGIMCYLNL